MPTSWFLTPYVHTKGDDGIWMRQTEIATFAQDIAAADGYYEETEIDGDQALTNVLAPAGIIRLLGRNYPEYPTDAEAQAVWTPLRAVPYYDAASDSIKFSTTEFAPCLPLSVISDRVKFHGQAPGVGSAELMALIGLWLGIGFGLGWRLPYEIAYWAARTIGEPTTFWRELLKFTFATDGTFPVNTAVLEDFTGADANPIDTGWGQFISSLVLFKRISNQGAGTAAGAHVNGYWNGATFGAGQGIETYFDTPVAYLTETVRYFIATTRITDPGASSDDCYEVQLFGSGATTSGMYRRDNGTGTTLGALFIAPVLADGDSMGLDHVSGTVACYLKTGGSWSQITTRADATYDSAGYLGWRTNLLGGRIDNFGGGTVYVSALVPKNILTMFPKKKMRDPILQGRVY